MNAGAFSQSCDPLADDAAAAGCGVSALSMDIVVTRAVPTASAMSDDAGALLRAVTSVLADASALKAAAAAGLGAAASAAAQSTMGDAGRPALLSDICSDLLAATAMTYAADPSAAPAASSVLAVVGGNTGISNGAVIGIGAGAGVSIGLLTGLYYHRRQAGRPDRSKPQGSTPAAAPGHTSRHSGFGLIGDPGSHNSKQALGAASRRRVDMQAHASRAPGHAAQTLNPILAAAERTPAPHNSNLGLQLTAPRRAALGAPMGVSRSVLDEDALGIPVSLGEGASGASV
jgi:hypothetical protein